MIHNVHTLYTHLTIVAINYLFYQGKLNKTKFYKLDNYTCMINGYHFIHRILWLKIYTFETLITK